MTRQALAVAAKAPRAGLVKTRLVGLLSEDDAAEAYRCFLRDTLEMAESVPGAEVVISYAPAGSEDCFEGLLARRHTMIPQRGTSLGEVIRHAFEDLFAAGYESAVLMNADSPTLPARFVVEALEHLRRSEDSVVLGPAEDGGYYLVGLKRPHPRLFEGISWSTDRVLEQTIARAGDINLAVMLLPPWYDVDGAAEFERLKAEVLRRSDDEADRTARHTREFFLSRSRRGSQSSV